MIPPSSARSTARDTLQTTASVANDSGRIPSTLITRSTITATIHAANSATNQDDGNAATANAGAVHGDNVTNMWAQASTIKNTRYPSRTILMAHLHKKCNP